MGSAIKNYVASTRHKEQHEESTIVLATNNKFIIHGFFYERREGHEAG
jgi:hypothetical protein